MQEFQSNRTLISQGIVLFHMKNACVVFSDAWQFVSDCTTCFDHCTTTMYVVPRAGHRT
jgi:hypothetical protein